MGTEVPLGTAALPVLDSLCKSHLKMRPMMGRVLRSTEPSQLSPAFPITFSQSSCVCQPHQCLQNTFPQAASLMGYFPRGTLCQALSPPHADAWLQRSIPAALLVVELPSALCKPSPQCRCLGLDLLLLASGAAWGHL